MRGRYRGVRAGLLALAATGALCAGTVADAAAAERPSARADSRVTADCPYPYVCLYKDGKRIGQFQDVTSGWQELPSRPSGTILVVNTRNDDTAYIRQSDGGVTCIAPNSTMSFTNYTLTGIRISSSPTC